MFLIRSAFWLALLVALVPSDPGEQARMYQTASYAVYRAVTFCDRNPLICTEAQTYWAIFKEKAAAGTRMASDLVNERLAAKQAAQAEPPLLEQPLPPADTLRASDRTPEWRMRVRSHL
jgi:hypothetical protein